jgi:A/G-specific adenine glycosylase
MKVSLPSGADGPGTAQLRPLREARLRRFRAALLKWYGPRARPLRIRTTREPWSILVSEIMAQQTQIVRVDEAWAGFMDRYPTPSALAQAPTAEVLRAWAGLGYNRRALNLRRAAGVIADEHGGRVPSSVAELEELPGVGPYTSRAIAAIAFGQPVAAVDTNVRRVVGRVTGRTLAPSALQAEADAWVDTADPATWTHATMELGATVCLARRPRCEACPVSRWCASVGRVEPARSQAAASSVPFEHTTRWLRGRIIDRLRTLDDGTWEHPPRSIGRHDEAAVAAAITALEREGLLERRPDGAVRLPSG